MNNNKYLYIRVQFFHYNSFNIYNLAKILQDKYHPIDLFAFFFFSTPVFPWYARSNLVTFVEFSLNKQYQQHSEQREKTQKAPLPGLLSLLLLHTKCGATLNLNLNT